MRIFLIGYMGSGKTTVGALLGAKMGLPFIDMDAYIVEMTGCTVTQLFKGRGEASFRCIEEEAIRELFHYDHAVIATGGGTPCIPNMIDELNRSGTTVYLNVPSDQLSERLEAIAKHRPLIADMETKERTRFIEEHLAERRPIYEKAELVVDATGAPKEVMQSVLKGLLVHSK